MQDYIDSARRNRKLARYVNRKWSLEDLFTPVAYVILTIWAILALFPMYWMFKAAFEPTQIMELWPPRFLPWWDKLTIHGFLMVWKRLPVPRWTLNSLIVCTVRVLQTMFFGGMTGYAFAKIRFWGRDTLFWFFMGVIMLPSFLTIIPQYNLIYRLGWLNTWYALLVPGFSGGIGTMFLVRQFLRSLPMEIIESARMDGANQFVIYMRIILPLAKPALAILAIFAFQGSWNDFFWPLMVTSSPDMRVLSLGIAMLATGTSGGIYVPDRNQIFAGSVMLAVPMIIVFLAFQRYFLKGITIGAVKG
jgi:multiple sugar transport system permease protein